LPAKYVIHVVGPRFQAGQNNSELLRQAVKAALDAAALSGCKSLALPAISAGIFGYPRADACEVIVTACRDWLDRRPGILSEVRFVGYDEAAAEDFRKAVNSQ
jgi:O-acetyl-ADP-ribose deacetylase (regulator of RNase III)